MAWVAVWLVDLSFLIPLLLRNGTSRLAERVTDVLLLFLILLSIPSSYLARLIVWIAHHSLEVNPLILTLTWDFVAGYVQWALLLLTLSWLYSRDRDGIGLGTW